MYGQFPLLFVYKQELYQWMHKTTKRTAPSGRAVLTRTTRKDKHRKYRPISEMMNALKLNQYFFEGLNYRDRSIMRWTIRITVVKEKFYFRFL